MRAAVCACFCLVIACKKEPVDVGPAHASAVVAAVFSETASATVDVLKVTEDGPFYRVTIASRETREPQDVLITRDGKRVTERVVDVDTELRKLAEDRRFADCLLAHKVSLLGAAGTPATTDQLMLLGRFGHKLLVRCDLEPENCKKLGASTFPSILADGTVHPGLRTRAWLETLTGCK
jgi:hypothetical protein